MFCPSPSNCLTNWVMLGCVERDEYKEMCTLGLAVRGLLAFARGGAVVVPTLSLLLPLGAYGALTAVGVDGSKAGALSFSVKRLASRAVFNRWWQSMQGSNSFLCVAIHVSCWRDDPTYPCLVCFLLRFMPLVGRYTTGPTALFF